MDDKNTTIVDDKEEIVDGEVLDTAGETRRSMRRSASSAVGRRARPVR